MIACIYKFYFGVIQYRPLKVWSLRMAWAIVFVACAYAWTLQKDTAPDAWM